MTRQSGRWLVTVLAGVFALLAIFSGFDRASEHQPGIVRLVPEPFRADAWRAETVLALTLDSEEAFGLAGRALSSDPLDARGPAFLGAALLARGDKSAAVEAFAVADRLSMREPLLQAFFFDVAVEQADYAEAARRLDVLLRAHPRLASIDYFFASLETSEAGRAELAARISDDPRWSAPYLGDFRSGDAVLRSRARFLGQSALSTGLVCEQVDPLVRELARRNLLADARAISVAFCEEGSGGELVADAQFEQFGGDSPFGWRRHGSGDVRIATVGTANRSIEIENRSGVTRLVLSQPVALEAGEYLLRARVSGTGEDRLLASIACGSPGRPTGRETLAQGQRLSAPECPDQVLGIWVRPGRGAVGLDDIRLTRSDD